MLFVDIMLSKVLWSLVLLSSNVMVSAHTWIEQMQVIGENGSYVGDYGYPRGYVARTDPGFDGFADKWQLPSPDTDIGKTRIDSSMMACHPSQRTANYSSEYPKLSVTPGDYVAMKYLENGHVSQPNIPEGKPKGSGTVYVFGTYEPSESDTLMDVLSWTTDGNGGNGKGWLMTAQSYDDHRCAQINNSPISAQRQAINGPVETWCETDLQIPTNAKEDSTLSVYWVWDWRTEGPGCKDEYYTTCADVDVVKSAGDLSTTAQHSLVQQSPQKDAVSDYKSRTAYTPTPVIITTQGCDATQAAPSSPATSAPEMSSAPSVPTSAPEMSSAPSAPNNLTTSAASPPSAPQMSSAPAAPNNATTTTAAPTADNAVTVTSTALSTVSAPKNIIFKTVTVPDSAVPSNTAPAPTAPTSKHGIIGKDATTGEIGKRSAQHVQAHGRLRHNVRGFA